jgi:hypothetical protein
LPLLLPVKGHRVNERKVSCLVIIITIITSDAHYIYNTYEITASYLSCALVPAKSFLIGLAKIPGGLEEETQICKYRSVGGANFF